MYCKCLRPLNSFMDQPFRHLKLIFTQPETSAVRNPNPAHFNFPRYRTTVDARINTTYYRCHLPPSPLSKVIFPNQLTDHAKIMHLTGFKMSDSMRIARRRFLWGASDFDIGPILQLHREQIAGCFWVTGSILERKHRAACQCKCTTLRHVFLRSSKTGL